jgi:hypothetical protein
MDPLDRDRRDYGTLVDLGRLIALCCMRFAHPTRIRYLVRENERKRKKKENDRD